MKRKLLSLICALLTSIASWAGTDYTSSMSNSTSNWTGVGSQTSIQACKTDGVETYQGNTTQFAKGDVLYQTISGLPNGFYQISFYAWENWAPWDENANLSYGNDIAQVFANTTVKGIEVIKDKDGRDWNAANTYTLVAQVTDGTLKYGVKNIAAGGNWAACKPISLTYIGTTDLTEAITNPSFETGDKTGWTDNDTGNATLAIQNNTSLEGKVGTYYAEMWWWDNTIDIYQTTQALPSGFYRITALAKADDGTNIVLYAKAGSSDEITTSVSNVQDYSVEVYLTSPGNIKFGLKGQHYHAKHVGVDNFRLTYLGNAKGELSALQGTIDDSYLNNATYTNVGGSERTALTSAKTLTAASETAAAYETAIGTVQDAIDAFVAAKDNYDALAAINAKITAVGTLTYASSAKKPSTHVGTSSSDAASYATSLTTALRAYVESNALGEGVSATDYTNEITNALCPGPKRGNDKEDQTADGWSILKVNFDGDEGWTGSTTSHNVYYASHGHFWGNFSGSRIANMSQTISDLPTGKYLLTVRAKSSGDIPTFYISGNGKQQIITHPNGVFGNGWDDTSVLFTVGADGEATIELQAEKEYDAYTGHWFSADNFRLVRLGNLDEVTIAESATSSPTTSTTDYKNVTLTRTLSNAYWNTFCSPIDIDAATITSTFGEGTKITELDTDTEVSDNILTFKEATEIVAGKPYLIKPANTTENPVFDGFKVTATEGLTITNGDFKFIGVIPQTEVTKTGESSSTNYFLNTSNQVVKLSADGNLKGMRAYFNVASGVSLVRLFIDDTETSISEIDNGELNIENQKIYNLAGQRVSKAQKGVYIVNGKKVVIK